MRLSRPTFPKFRLTFSKVLVGTAVVLVTTTGVAYAANTVGSDDIIDNSIRSVDVKDGGLGSVDLVDGNVKSADLKDGDVRSIDIQNESILTGDILDGAITSADVLDDTLTALDLATNSVSSAEIATDAVNATEIANDSIDSGEIVDFSLSNQDIGVLFAQVNANGTLANSSGGGVTVTKLAGLGTYEVDFARNIASCAFVATQGGAGVGSSGGAIIGVTDRSGNGEAVFLTTRDAAGSLVDRDFHLVVVC